MSVPKILLTGPTGFIGGSLLTELFAAGITTQYPVSVLVRGEDRAKVLETKFGVKTYLFRSLDETDLLRKVAGEHDIVIHTATGYHTASAKALILGLADRKEKTGGRVHYLHTSGTSNVADQPISKKYLDPTPRIFSDKHDDIYTYLKYRETLHAYAQRTTDVVVVETGLEVGVPTTILMSPTIYGLGTGPFNTLSLQIPLLIRLSLSSKRARFLGPGTATWDYVHISDVVTLYLLLLKRVLSAFQSPDNISPDIPTGKGGFMFSGTGRFTWKEVSEGIAEALFTAGVVGGKEVESLGVGELAREFMGGDELLAELAVGSNSRTVADYAFEMGWKPQKTEEDFKNQYEEQVILILKE